MINPEKLTEDVCEALARDVVDGWDMECLLDYAISCLTVHFLENKEEAVKTMEEQELTVEDLLESHSQGLTMNIKEVYLTADQMLAIKCAYNDLVGAFNSYKQQDIHSHDWDGVKQTIFDLEATFGFIEPAHVEGEDDAS